MCRPIARSGNRGVWKTNVDLTSGRWPRWVARYEKGGVGSPLQGRYTKSGGGQFASGPLRKVGGGGGQFASGPLRKVGGAIRFRSITKSGGGGGGAIRFRSITKSGGGGGAICFRSITKSGGGSDVSSPIGVWGKAPEASQAGTCTT